MCAGGQRAVAPQGGDLQFLGPSDPVQLVVVHSLIAVSFSNQGWMRTLRALRSAMAR